MKNYINKLNWDGFILMFMICGLGVMNMTENLKILTSLMIWLMVGLPVSFIFLFIGRGEN